MTDGLLDTTFFVDVRRGNHAGADQVWDAIKTGQRTGAVSAVTAYELWVGARFSREEELLFESMFAALESVPIDAATAKQAAIWLRNAGGRSEILFRDALIGAAALARSEKVISANVRDFTLFPGVEVETY